MVRRPDRSTSKAAKEFTLVDVKNVTDTMIRYQKKRASDMLKRLRKVLTESDLVGGTGVAYFANQWRMLVDRYR